MKDPARTLASLGFSPNEVTVYLALNRAGSQKAGRIAKLAAIDRSSCYNTLRSLAQKGLVSYVTIGRVKWFQSTGPKLLRDYVKAQLDDVEEIIPELHAQHKAGKLEGQVRLFKGPKGVRSLFLDIIRAGQDNMVFGSEGQFSDRMPEFAAQFQRMRVERGIKTKLVCRAGREENDTPHSMHRYLDVEASPAVTNIYGDKIAIVIWTDEPEGVLIENAAAAKAYRSYFEVLWRTAKASSTTKRRRA